MTTAIWSPSNTPIVWVARRVNDFLKVTVHSDRVHKSRRCSDQLVSGDIRRTESTLRHPSEGGHLG